MRTNKFRPIYITPSICHSSTFMLFLSYISAAEFVLSYMEFVLLLIYLFFFFCCGEFPLFLVLSGSQLSFFLHYRRRLMAA